MVYFYAIVAGSFDVLAGWFALQGRAEKLQRRYITEHALLGLRPAPGSSPHGDWRLHEQTPHPAPGP